MHIYYTPEVRYMQLMELWYSVKNYAARFAMRYNIRGYTMDDLLQESFLAMIAAAETYDPNAGKTFLGWYHFYLLGMYRRLTKKSDLIVGAESLDAPINDDGLTLSDTLQDDSIDMDGDIYRDEIRGAVGALEGSERRVIIARYYEGMTVNQAAAALDISTADVRRLSSHALGKLRQKTCIQDHDLYSGNGLQHFLNTGQSQVEHIVFRANGWT